MMGSLRCLNVEKESALIYKRATIVYIRICIVVILWIRRLLQKSMYSFPAFKSGVFVGEMVFFSPPKWEVLVIVRPQ